jgi:hypothetical protein
MATKRSIPKRGKSLSFISKVKSLQSCVRQDLAKLAKCYPTALTDVDRAIKSVSLALKKAKTSRTSKSKTASGKLAVTKARSTALALQKQLNGLRSEKLAIQASMRKFSSQRNALQQLEKSWPKTAKVRSSKSRGTLKSTRKAGSRKLARGGLRSGVSTALLSGHHAWGMQ